MEKNLPKKPISKKTPIYKDFPLTGNVLVDIDVIEKIWDYRFVLFKFSVYGKKDEYKYRFVQYLRRGSSSTQYKFDISSEQAEELINRLSLVETKLNSASTWRKEGFSELDMLKKSVKK